MWQCHSKQVNKYHAELEREHPLWCGAFSEDLQDGALVRAT
jgi:hypothetical protein